MQRNAGHDLAGLAAHVELEFEEFVRAGHVFRLQHLRHAQLDLAKVSNLDLGKGHDVEFLLFGRNVRSWRFRFDGLVAREQAFARGERGARLQSTENTQSVERRIASGRANLFAQGLHFRGHHRPEQRRTDAQAFQHQIQCVGQRLGIGGFGLFPGFAHSDILVGFANGVHDGGEAQIGAHRGHLRLHRVHGLHHGTPEGRGRRIVQQLRRRGRDAAAAGTVGDFQHAAGEVAQVVGQVAVVALHEHFLGKRSVLTQTHFGHEEIAQGVDAEAVGVVEGIHHVAGGFAHFVAAAEPPSVGEDAAGHFHAHGLQHGGPVDRVGGENVLADEVDGAGPAAGKGRVVALVAHGGDVVHQRVEPHVADVVGVEGQFDAPGQAGLRTADAEVGEGFAKKSKGFVAAEIGLDELRVRFDVVDQPLLVLAHAEEVVALLDHLHVGGKIVDAAPLGQILFGDERLAAHIVETVVVGGIDFPAVVEVLQDGLHDAGVAGLGGADKIVVGDLQTLPEFLEAEDRFIHVLLGGNAPRGGGFLHLLAMLVGAREEPGVVAKQTVGAGQHVRQHRRVGVANVGFVVDVIDGGADVKVLLRHGGISGWPTPLAVFSA